MDLTLSLNHRCNLRCTYCYGGRKQNRPMSMEVARKGLDLAFARPTPITHVLFFGGEPLLEPERIDAIATEARGRGVQAGVTVRFGLTTNGTLLTDERLAMLERHRALVTVSLDGIEPAHDSARLAPGGRPTFKKVVKGLRRTLDRLGVARTISVVHPGNVQHMPESFDFIRSLGVRHLAFNVDYSADWSEADIERLGAAYEGLADRALARYRAGDDFVVRPLHSKIVSQLKGGFSDEDKCDFGCRELAVAPSGNIYPCDRMIGEDGPAQKDVVIGHVDTGLDWRRLFALKRPKDEVKSDCEGCTLLRRCTWWCGCVNRAVTGRVDGVGGLLCKVEQHTIRAADRLAATLYAEANPPFVARYYTAAARAAR